MPLSKIQLQPGVNKEGTRYSAEEGWNDSDKVRFRKGLPEKIGGWRRISSAVFDGICRSLHTWRTLASKLYVGVGTNTKFYIESAGTYYDVTPTESATATVKLATSSSTTVTLEDNVGTIRVGMTVTGTDASGSALSATVDAVASQGSITLGTSTSLALNAILHFNATGTLAANPLVTGASASTTVYVVDTNGGYQDGDYVTFGGTVATVDGITQSILLGGGSSKEYQISYNTAEQATAQINNGSPSSSTTVLLDTNVGTIAIGMTMTGTDSSGAAVSEIVTAISDQNEITIANAKTMPNNNAVSFAYTDAYAITVSNASAGTATKGGGSAITATYKINSGDEIEVATDGWGAGAWGGGTWSDGLSSIGSIRLWGQANFGEDLVLNFRGGPLYYWDGDGALTTTAHLLSSRTGALSVPAVANKILVSDINRFVFCFGTTAYLDTTNTLDPLLIRWSDQDSAVDWRPAADSFSASLRLSRGGEIITAVQARQEILVWTDAALYNLQFLGTDGWGAQLVGENISIAGPNAVAYANGMAFWMGKDKFYIYDGNTKPLNSSVHRHVFNNISPTQQAQIYAGTNEAFNEIWWFYPSENSTTNDLYVVYNYLENIWYNGTLARTAWEDSGIRTSPLAATYTKNLVDHESGIDDGEGATLAGITASITSGEFDIEDGNRMAFVWRLLPDLTFDGSEGAPSATLSLLPLKSSGSGYNDPLSEGGSNSGVVTQGTTITVEPYTTQINTRIRGRQMAFKIESTDIGVKWQLGYPRIDMRPDGRR